MTFREFMDKVSRTFPEATVGEDNDGQLVIYTNLRETPDGNVESIDTHDYSRRDDK